MSWLSMNPCIRDWAHQNVWIVGASSGIGAELAEQLLQKGARVAISARRSEPLHALASRYPTLCSVVPMDATEPSAWRANCNLLDAQWGRIDLVVFCAADYKAVRSWELNAADVKRTVEINLNSVYYGLELLVPFFIKQQSGGIALVSSVASYMGLPKATVYGPTKAALSNLAEILYSELHDQGIGVYLINPGFVKTRLTALNDFHMPALMTTTQAAHHIVRGFEHGVFEIHFPKRFSFSLKLMRLLPARARLAMLKSLARSA